MFDDHQTSAMDLRDARVKHDTPEARLPADTGPSLKRNRLDGPDMMALHGRLMSWHENELARQQPNRAEQEQDEDMYDNIQWDPKDAQDVRDRGQVPLVYNVLSSMIDWVLGTEKRGRTDFKVLPRRKDAGKPAQRKSELLKYLSDVNRTPFHTSRAFEDAVKVGVGWLECGVQDDDDGEPVYDRYESWRNILWDSAGTEMDLSDARYIDRFKWVDEDVAKALVPSRVGAIEEAVVNGPYYGYDLIDGDEASDSREDYLMSTTSLTSSAFAYARRRVRLIEMWFRMPTRVKRIRGGDFSGEIFDPHADNHREAVQSGQSIVVEKVMMRMHVALMTTKSILYLGESPYRHNNFPFTPIWFKRRGRDGMPYGMIRGAKDIQQDINRRAAKALAILSMNKVIMDEGAVDDLDEFAEEVARPDAIIVKKSGKELTINADRELGAANLEMMSRSILMLQSQSGVTDELMGRTTNAKSGVAIQARQNQGSMATAGPFDNLRFAKQIHGEKQLSLVEQYFTEEKSFRITNMRGTPEYVTINDGMPENDIVRTKADYIISEADWRASVRQAQTEELLALLQQLAPVAPQIALILLDLLVEEMDISSRDEMVRRIREQTGMRDPDAEEPTPEEQAKAQAAAEQAEMQKRMVMAQIAEKEASAQQKAAQAAKTGADAKAVLATMAGANVASQKAALETALMMLSAPPAAPVADGVLHEAGFVSRTEDENTQAALMAAAQQQQQAEQAQAAAQQQAAPPPDTSQQQQPQTQPPSM
ncbi:hypothetical protein V5F77_04340 [Xanthobacter sp. DSM 24535]|uniref:portal protein n=1 Tax=Roseixanthobacter psychrophilus TaxID=3119917 RepID=UPI00372BFB85